jgi:D-serine deaminase-like pyridoxal phosphate-dependent protein
MKTQSCDPSELSKWIGCQKLELDTPCLVVDLDGLEENLRRMEKAVRPLGKALRPHVKTHKCSMIARKQVAAGAVGLCVAKLSEAEALIDRGLRGVLVTGPVVTPQKINRLLDVVEKDPSLMVVVDHIQNIQALQKAALSKGLIVPVLLDVDIGLHRTGETPARMLELAARIADQSALCLKGIQAYAGHVQHMKNHALRRQASLESFQPAMDMLHQIRRAGIPCEIVSGGGTGTFDIDTAIPEFTELQAGSYVFMDAEYLEVGSADQAERFTEFLPALTLLTTVVSVNQKDFVTVDAGLKALYKDGASPIVRHPSGQRLRYDWFGDEYGKISFDPGSAGPSLGGRIELIVSHCDPTVNLFDSLFVTQNDRVVDVWPVDLRGKCH